MSETFLISDTHFSHKGILEFSSTKPFRPFATIEEHDEELVKRWNSVVRKRDNVWHLGDVVFGRRNLLILGRLNGLKRLIMGNHDLYRAEEYLKYFSRLFGVVEYKGMIFSHVPVHPQQKERYRMNVHGHLHTERVIKSKKHFPEFDGSITTITEYDPWYFCVSAEQINLTPIPLDLVIEKIPR